MAVAEAHGVWTSGGDDNSVNQWIDVRHVGEAGISIAHTKYQNPVMTVEQARYLASKLNRLASKIEDKDA